MSPWSWWWIEAGEDEHGGWQGDCRTKAEVVAAANRELPPNTQFEVIEARSSEAREHEESECVPFLRVRNRETMVAEVQP